VTSGQSTFDGRSSVSGTEESSRVSATRLARLIQAPAVWVAALVGASTLVRGALGLLVPSPWVLPDEIVYSDLAKSIAAGHRPAVRGVPVFGWGEVYPTLIAPAWALINDPVSSYHAALAISALVMSLAAVPAYFLARLFVSRRMAVLAAVMTVLVPSMAYTGLLMTENAFYPVFLLSVFLIAKAVQRPTPGRQALAIAGLVLVAFTRVQGLALVGAYLVAVVVYACTGERSARVGYLSRFTPTAVVLVSAMLAPVVASVVRGVGPFGWLGARSGTFAEFHAHEVPRWFVYLASDLILYVAVIPAAATAVVIARGLRRGAPDHVRLFAAVALPTLAAMLGSVALVSASLDVDGRENLNERYVFYVVPLLFCGLALWISEGLPRRRSWALLVVASSCLLAVLLPMDRLGYNAEFQSPALLPWLRLSLGPDVLAVCLGLFAIAAGGLWLTCPRNRTGWLFLTVIGWMTFVAAVAVGQQTHPAKYYANAYADASAGWVDAAVPEGAKVAVVWDQRVASRSPDFFSFWLMVTEFFNPSVGDVYSVGGRTYYDTFLPTISARLMPNGTVTDGHGHAVRARYVLSTCKTPIRGRLIRRTSHGALRLVAVDGPVRVESRGRRCSRSKP
jgi:hypothetical protein